MNISEIFYSIQGEGKFVGTPSTFIRTSGCNLRCDWCDTPYTSWEPEVNRTGIKEIISKVSEVTSDNASHIVITGGEPFIQPDLGDLVKELHKDDYFVTIETNGTIFKDVGADLYSISPKLENSIPLNHERERKIHESNRDKGFESLYKFPKDKSIFKYVIQSEKDLEEVETQIDLLQLEPSQIYLMPEGRTKDEVNSRTHELIDLCKDRGFNFSPRLHIDIWGDKRGV
jgi:7-carboxy-7-deazaguanine synthase|tara:strand:- start:9190 stop:9876 length:687 start_codon:yes stop_codon:yes gene_type:complete